MFLIMCILLCNYPMSFSLLTDKCHFHFEMFMSAEQLKRSCQCAEMRSTPKPVLLIASTDFDTECISPLFFFFFCSLGYIIDNTKLPSPSAGFLGGCATRCYISVTDLTKPVSFLQIQEKPSLYQFCTYFYTISIARCISKSCQFCVKTLPRLLTYFTISLSSPWSKSPSSLAWIIALVSYLLLLLLLQSFYHQNKNRDPAYNPRQVCPLLRARQWLPVSERAKSKVLSVAYKTPHVWSCPTSPSLTHLLPCPQELAGFSHIAPFLFSQGLCTSWQKSHFSSLPSLLPHLVGVPPFSSPSGLPSKTFP